MAIIIQPYLSAFAQIIIVAPVTILFSLILFVASVLRALFISPPLLVPKTILITGRNIERKVYMGGRGS
jgi:hypothetical protein